MSTPRLNGRMVEDTGIPCPACADIGHTTIGGYTPTLRRLPNAQRREDEPDIPFCLGRHGYAIP